MSYELARANVRRNAGVKTGRGSGVAVQSQLGGVWDFLTQSGPLFGPSPDVVLSTWAAQVTARGNFVTRMPSGAQVGKLGERHVDATTGQYTIALAPANVLQADAAQIAAGASTIATDQFFDALQPTAIASDATKLAKATVTAVTGIPSWAIPVLIIGGGAFVLISATHSLFPKGR